MGGQLILKSQIGVGSIFSFTLELPKSTLHKAVSNANFRLLPSLNDLKILVVDDNPINIKSMLRFLEIWGATYESCNDGMTAVKKIQAENFDLVLMDLEMPIMDGYTAINKLKTLGIEIPAIAFTAALFSDMEEKLAIAGFDGFILKPFKPEELHDKLYKYATKKQNKLSISVQSAN
jgi:CheY-like chemotaxis protein